MADAERFPAGMTGSREPAGFVWRRLALVGAIAGALALGWTIRGAGLGRAASDGSGPGLTGQLLVATDELRDPRFVHTVIYMVRHDAGGAMGLVVNRAVGQVTFRELLDHLGTDSAGVRGELRLHYGGPVDGTRGFVLHTSDYTIEGTQVVADGIALTSQPEILRAMGTGAGPRLTLFALGYAGWAAGQLEAEIKAGYWIGVPADEELVFGNETDKKWDRAMARRMFTL